MNHAGNMCTNRHVKTGKTLLEFPSCPPVERVTDYGLQGRADQDAIVKAPIIGGAVQMQTHSISSELSVIYLMTQRRNLLSGIYDEELFGIDIKCYPLKGHNKRCMIIPIHGQKLSSLTDKCVCLDCLSTIASRAERKRKDAVKYIDRKLLGNTSIVTVRAGVVAQVGMNHPT